MEQELPELNWDLACSKQGERYHDKGFFHVVINCGDGFYKYWCKNSFDRNVQWHDSRQLKLPLGEV